LEFFLLTLLAFVAAFRGWGFWAFLLLAVPFAPEFVNVSKGGSLTLQGSLVGLVWWVPAAGLGLMILMGRDTAAN
jgi:hypothetical protein